MHALAQPAAASPRADPVSRPSCWKFDRWPEIDRTLWEQSCAPASIFDDPGYGTTLRSASLEKTAKGYGRWLCFLYSRGWLDPSRNPLDRVTKGRLRAFFLDMQTAGNADHTIIGRFSELTMAMKILAPGRDSSWIRKPNGTTVYAGLPKMKRVLLVPDSAILLGWGYEVLAQASHKPTELERICACRDGLLFMILACCGRRLRSVSLMRLGHELAYTGDAYRVDLKPEQVKTGLPDRFDLPSALTPHVDRYVRETRPALLKGKTCEAFWISGKGSTWTAKAIQNQVLELSRKRFGKAFGPHRFRHAMATTAPILDPANPGLAAALLGISQEVIDSSYNRSGQNNAALAYHVSLERRRAILSGITRFYQSEEPTSHPKRQVSSSLEGQKIAPLKQQAAEYSWLRSTCFTPLTPTR